MTGKISERNDFGEVFDVDSLESLDAEAMAVTVNDFIKRAQARFDDLKERLNDKNIFQFDLQCEILLALGSIIEMLGLILRILNKNPEVLKNDARFISLIGMLAQINITNQNKYPLLCKKLRFLITKHSCELEKSEDGNCEIEAALSQTREPVKAFISETGNYVNNVIDGPKMDEVVEQDWSVEPNLEPDAKRVEKVEVKVDIVPTNRNRILPQRNVNDKVLSEEEEIDIRNPHLVAFKNITWKEIPDSNSSEFGPFLKLCKFCECAYEIEQLYFQDGIGLSAFLGEQVGLLKGYDRLISEGGLRIKIFEIYGVSSGVLSKERATLELLKNEAEQHFSQLTRVGHLMELFRFSGLKIAPLRPITFDDSQSLSHKLNSLHELEDFIESIKIVELQLPALLKDYSSFFSLGKSIPFIEANQKSLNLLRVSVLNLANMIDLVNGTTVTFGQKQ